MLIYEEGGHFVPHRDTEKEDGMFGTMIIQLPTINGFIGGALSVTHNGKCQTLDLSIDSAKKFYEIAFYADCVHELHPITSGKRVCLVYNLATTKPKNSITNQNVNIETGEKFRAIWANWNGDGEEKICKLGYQLEHEYTYKNFGVSSLKGKDEIVFATLKNAKSDTGERLFCVSLLLLEWYHLTEGYMGDCRSESDKYKPLRVIVENADGSFTVMWEIDIDSKDSYQNTEVPDSINNEWNMMCQSRNGWWILPIDKEKAGVNVSDDAYEKFCEDDEYTESNDYVDFEKQMFIVEYQCDQESIQTGFLGNEGDYFEKWYFAAAIVISPHVPKE